MQFLDAIYIFLGELYLKTDSSRNIGDLFCSAHGLVLKG